MPMPPRDLREAFYHDAPGGIPIRSSRSRPAMSSSLLEEQPGSLWRRTISGAYLWVLRSKISRVCVPVATCEVFPPLFDSFRSEPLIGPLTDLTGIHWLIAWRRKRSGQAAIERGVAFQVCPQALRIRGCVGRSLRHQLCHQAIEGGNHLGLQRLLGGCADTASLGGNEGKQQESPGDRGAHGFP